MTPDVVCQPIFEQYQRGETSAEQALAEIIASVPNQTPELRPQLTDPDAAAIVFKLCLAVADDVAGAVLKLVEVLGQFGVAVVL